MSDSTLSGVTQTAATTASDPYANLPTEYSTSDIVASRQTDYIQQIKSTLFGDDLTGITNNVDYNNTTDYGGGTIDVPTGKGWESTHYADDLINSQIQGVKPKFLYKVKFVINSRHGYTAEEIQKVQKAQFLVKTIDKPTIQMEYQDVNYYNYRTKVLTKVSFNPLNIVFFDDASNFVTNMISQYMAHISPIFNHRGHELNERVGMNSDPSLASASSRSSYSFFNEIVIQQIYGHGTASTIFRFINPRIEQFDFDGLDHEDSAPNLVTCSFIYDYIVVETSSAGSLIYGAKELVGAKTDLFSGGAISAKSGINIKSSNDLMSTINGLAGGTLTEAGSKIINGMTGTSYDLQRISGTNGVNIASTLGMSKVTGSVLDSKLYNLTGRVSSKLSSGNPLINKIMSPIANKTISALSKPLQGVTTMVDKTISGAINGVGQAVSNSATTVVNSIIDGVSPAVNNVLHDVNSGISGLSDKVSGSFNSITSDINNGISSSIGGAMDSIKNGFDDASNAINTALSESSDTTENPVEGVGQVYDNNN